MSTETIIGYDDLNITSQDIFEELGYRNDTPRVEVKEAVNEVISHLSQVCPRFYFETFEGKLSKETLVINNVEFNTGKIIASQLKKSDQFILFAATAGQELNSYLEILKRNNDVLNLYLADCIGSIIAERTADKMESGLYDQLYTEGFSHTNRFSPGYCGWDVSEQQKLFSLLPPNVCGITLTSSSLMIPVKSVSGVIGIGPGVLRKEYTCNLCNHKNCYKRREM